MADLDFDVEVDGIQQTFERLEQDLKDGIEDGINDLLDLAEEEAQTTVRLHDRIFNREVYNGFRKDDADWDGPADASGSIRNTAPHAAIVEYGADYETKGPPVQALIPWVERNLNSWAIDVDTGGGPGPDAPSPGDDQDSTNSPDVDANWQQFDNNGIDADELWIGQQVTVYDGDKGRYVNGEIYDYDLRGIARIRYASGEENDFYYREGAMSDGTGIYAGEAWETLTDDEQTLVAQRMLTNVEIDSSFDSRPRQMVDEVLDQFSINAKNPRHIKRLAVGITRIKRDDSIPAIGRWQGGEYSGTLILNQPKFDKNTMRHELGHAFIGLHGYDYADGARHNDAGSGELWDSVRRWKQNSELPWNYDEIGEENWETEAGNPLPHPTKYMLHDEETRQFSSLYDDPDDPAFDSWKEYIWKDTKYQIQSVDDDGPPDYDPFYTEEMVLDPDNPRARTGDAMHFAWEDGGAAKDFHVKIESSVYKKSDDTGYAIDISQDGNAKSLDVTDEGRLADENLYFYGFLPGGADDLNGGDGTVLNEEDIPTDPGFYADADDVMGRLREGLNRHLFREMFATEFGDRNERSDWYLRADGYSATNAHETMAHFIAIVLDKENYGSEQAYAKQLLDESPLLLYQGNEVFDYSDEIKEALEDYTGMDFEDIMYDIWREFLK